jgi:hypothetical protein
VWIRLVYLNRNKLSQHFIKKAVHQTLHCLMRRQISSFSFNSCEHGNISDILSRVWRILCNLCRFNRNVGRPVRKMFRRVGLVRTDVSEEPSASINMVTLMGVLAITLAETSNRSMLRNNAKLLLLTFFLARRFLSI